MPVIANPSELDRQTFDFVIVGGGTAGCVLANRLSCRYRVLLLEAGTRTHDDLVESRVPLLNSRLKNTEVDWKLQSVSQPNADNRTIGIPLGKMLGGSSAFNACLWHRCSPSDYDAWHTNGWTYKDLKPYFCKAESFHPAHNVHGTSGPIHATDLEINPESLGHYFRRACQNTGLPDYDDLTDKPCQIGVTHVQSSIYQGERSSTGACYLPKDILERTNLTVAMGCHVTQILFNGDQADKVRFNHHNHDYVVHIGREIILSAGALFSPFLLLKSGIGPKDELARHGINTVVDLPGVGKNLQNHWRIPLVHETIEPEMSLHRDLFINTEATLKQALDQKTGAMTRIWPDAVAYMKIKMELFTGGLALCKQAGSLTHVNCATLLMVYLAPFSRGSVTISSKEGICIDLGLLSDKRDLECIEKGLRLSFDIANDPIYRDSCVKRWILPAEDMDQLNLEEYIKENIETIHHYAGTCKMGPKEDCMAVVDEHLKVYGVNNVRVVDASFFPIVPAGQICFPVIACAERAADIILDEHQP
ncbi:hypothetical protein RMATCC62417_03948 [Rhizopus microsporus]|nr:hypothetical protein RMATCC62417_03948 [Rhizopus microsporus]